MNAEPLCWYGTSDFVGKERQAYEGVYLPLLSNGETVDMILGAVHCVLRWTNFDIDLPARSPPPRPNSRANQSRIYQ